MFSLQNQKQQQQQDVLVKHYAHWQDQSQGHKASQHRCYLQMLDPRELHTIYTALCVDGKEQAQLQFTDNVPHLL